MLSYAVYKMIHFIGLALALFSLGAASGASIIAGGRPEKGRKLFAIGHGVGMFLILLGGFGMLARLQIHWPWPSFIVSKLVVWGLLAAWIGISFRLSPKRPLLALLAPVALASFAVWSVLFMRV